MIDKKHGQYQANEGFYPARCPVNHSGGRKEKIFNGNFSKMNKNQTMVHFVSFSQIFSLRYINNNNIISNFKIGKSKSQDF